MLLHSLYLWDDEQDPPALTMSHARSKLEEAFDLGKARYFSHRMSTHIVKAWPIQQRIVGRFPGDRPGPADSPRTDEGGKGVNLQVTGLVRMSRSVRRVLSPSAVARTRVAAIHLDVPLPARSSGLPGSSGGQPSDASCLALLRVGFTEPCRSPGALVVSYTTVSPLPWRALRRPRRSVLCGTVPRVTPGGRYPPPCPWSPDVPRQGAHRLPKERT